MIFDFPSNVDDLFDVGVCELPVDELAKNDELNMGGKGSDKGVLSRKTEEGDRVRTLSCHDIAKKSASSDKKGWAFVFEDSIHHTVRSDGVLAQN